jgi:hypothetical protein
VVKKLRLMTADPKGEGVMLQVTRLIFEALLQGLRDADPNRRIASIRSIGDGRWTAQEKAQIVAELMALREDENTDTYVYAGFMCDENEPATRVCDAAEAALGIITDPGDPSQSATWREE